MEQSIPKKLGMLALLTAGSLFAQTLLWVAYDYFQMQVWVMGALPLLICLLYHAVQLDSGADKLMGRRLVFAGACLLPLLLGAALGLWAFHIDFSLTCVLGVISLIGIVVRNAILIFEHAQDLRLHKHYSPRDAAFDAGRRRMLPIFLTSATTAVGVVPMIISGSSLWMPMGVVICSGTVFSMILAVIILPVFYWKIFGNK